MEKQLEWKILADNTYTLEIFGDVKVDECPLGKEVEFLMKKGVELHEISVTKYSLPKRFYSFFEDSKRACLLDEVLDSFLSHRPVLEPIFSEIKKNLKTFEADGRLTVSKVVSYDELQLGMAYFNQGRFVNGWFNYENCLRQDLTLPVFRDFLSKYFKLNSFDQFKKLFNFKGLPLEYLELIKEL